MPKNSKVGRCVRKVQKTGKSKGSAIAICQDATKQSYKTGKPAKHKPKSKRK